MERTSPKVAAVAARCLRYPEQASFDDIKMIAGSALTQHEPNHWALNEVHLGKRRAWRKGFAWGAGVFAAILVLVCVFGCQNAEIQGQKVKARQESIQRVEGERQTVTKIDPVTGEVTSTTVVKPSTEDKVSFDGEAQGASAKANGDGKAVADLDNKAPGVTPPPARPGEKQATVTGGDSEASVKAMAGNTVVRIVAFLLGAGCCYLGVLAIQRGKVRNAVGAFGAGGVLMLVALFPAVVELVLVGGLAFAIGWVVWTVIKSRQEVKSDGETKGAFESGIDTVVAQGPQALFNFLKNLKIAAPTEEYNKVEQYLKDNHFNVLLEALNLSPAAGSNNKPA